MKEKSKLKINLLAFLFFSFQAVYAQINFMGKPGLATIPKPDTNPQENSLLIGYSYMPNSYAKNNFMRRLSDESYFYLAILPVDWIRISSVITRPHGIDRIGIGDRHIDVQFRIIKERKNVPNISIILSPIFAGSNFLEHNTLLLSKSLQLGNKMTVEPVLGYSHKQMYTKPIKDWGLQTEQYQWLDRKYYGNSYLYGGFGGVQFSYDDKVFISGEYDSDFFNFSAGIIVLKGILMQASYLNKDKFSFSIAYQFRLNTTPPDIKKYEDR
jgi:hypothetical protein